MINDALLKIVVSVLLEKRFVWRAADGKIYIGESEPENQVWDRSLRYHAGYDVISESIKHPEVAADLVQKILEQDRIQVIGNIVGEVFDTHRKRLRELLKQEISNRGDSCLVIQLESKAQVWVREGEELKAQIASFEQRLPADMRAEFQDILAKSEGRITALYQR